MLEWIAENQNWFLQGLGVFLLGLIVSFVVWLFKRNKGAATGNSSQSMGDGAKAEKLTFENNKQVIGKDLDSPQENIGSATGNISQSMGDGAKAKKEITFKDNKQVIGKDIDSPQE